MKTRNKIIVTAVILILVVGLVVTFWPAKTTTFNEVVFDDANVQDITAVEFRKSNPSNIDIVTVNDPAEIQQIMSSLSEIEMKKEKIDVSSTDESYTLYIEMNSAMRYQIDLYDEQYIAIYDSELKKNKTTEYTITNNFDLSTIRGLFE